MKTALYRRRPGRGGNIITRVISAVLTPVTSTLTVGQSLDDTTNWATFLLASNYSSSDPADVDTPTVTVNYIGTTPDATTALADGNTNHFSITVTYLSGNTRTFNTVPRTTVYGVDPTVSLSVSSLSVVEGATSAGSTLATITLTNTSEAATLSGADAALFEIVSGNLRNVADLDTVGSFDVTVNISNSRPGSDSAAFALTVTEAPVAVNPSYALGAFTAGSGGSPDSVAVNGAYAGADTVDAYFATSNSATPPSAAQMEAGTGGTIEQSASVLGYTGAQADLSVFTDDTVSHLHAYFKERTNGGETTVSTTALTDIDFTAPTIDSWTTNTAGDTITGTISETVTVPDGQPATSDFTLAGVAAGSAIASVTVSGTTITISIAANAAVDTDTITIAYTKGVNTIQDARGNEVASFGATSVTNIVPAPPSFAPTLVTSGSVDLGNATLGAVLPTVAVTNGRLYLAIVTGRTVNSSGAVNGMTLGGATGVESIATATAVDNHHGAVYTFTATTTGNVALSISASDGGGFQGTAAAVWDITDGQIKGTPTTATVATGLSITHNQSLITGEYFLTGFACRNGDGVASASGYTELNTFPESPTALRFMGFGEHEAIATETRSISTTLSTAGNVAGAVAVNCVIEATP